MSWLMSFFLSQGTLVFNPGANPTIVSFNAGVVKFATQQIA
jgi:hypothetical protein